MWCCWLHCQKLHCLQGKEAVAALLCQQERRLIPPMSIPTVLWHSPPHKHSGGQVLPMVASKGCLAPPALEGCPPRHQPLWPGSSNGDNPNGFKLCLSPAPGFTDKQVLTKSCCFLPCLPHLCLHQPCCSWSMGL